MLGLILDWERCPDGVEVVDPAAHQKGRASERELMGLPPASPLKPRPAIDAYKCKTSGRVPAPYELKDLRDPLVVKFVNAREPAAMLTFLSTYGMPVAWEPIPVAMVEDMRRGLSSSLNWMKNASPQEATGAMNEMIHRHVAGGSDGAALAPRFDYVSLESPPRLTLVAFSLRAFMAMELALMAARGARVKMCEHCNNRFVTGPTTGRRGDARYCSDRCRVAASRGRKRADQG